MNGDGQFESGDFVAVFQHGEYEDGVALNSTWSRGDWNGDGEFDSGDLVHVMAKGGYRQAARLNGRRGQIASVSADIATPIIGDASAVIDGRWGADDFQNHFVRWTSPQQATFHFVFDASYDLQRFRLSNGSGFGNGGVHTFTLVLYDTDHRELSRYSGTSTRDAYYQFEQYAVSALGVSSVDLIVDSNFNSIGEIHEVEFVGLRSM